MGDGYLVIDTTGRTEYTAEAHVRLEGLDVRVESLPWETEDDLIVGCRDADVIMVAAAHITRQVLAAMRSTATLVNTARGGIVDEAVLSSALDSGEILADGLDVTEEETLPPDHTLRTQPRCVLTSHMGWYSEQAVQDLEVGAFEQVAAILRKDRA